MIQSGDKKFPITCIDLALTLNGEEKTILKCNYASNIHWAYYFFTEGIKNKDV